MYRDTIVNLVAYAIGEVLYLIQKQQYERGHSLQSIDFATMLQELAKPEAFLDVTLGDELEHESGDNDRLIRVIQTHASAVVLAGERAYKLKKPRKSWLSGLLDTYPAPSFLHAGGASQ